MVLQEAEESTIAVSKAPVQEVVMEMKLQACIW